MQLVTVIVDVVNTVSMDPPPYVSVTGQVVTVVYVVRVSVSFGGGDGVPMEDEDDSDLVKADTGELVGRMPVPTAGTDKLQVVPVFDVVALSVEWDVELEPHESFCVAVAEPTRTAVININEACILEM